MIVGKSHYLAILEYRNILLYVLCTSCFPCLNKQNNIESTSKLANNLSIKRILYHLYFIIMASTSKRNLIRATDTDFDNVAMGWFEEDSNVESESSDRVMTKLLTIMKL